MTATASKIDDDEELLELDPTCPWCGENVGYYDIAFDGTEHECRECDRPVVAAEWNDATMSWLKVEPEPRRPPDPRTGRQRTRALWRRKGRR